jgi:S-adenosylmethionine:tRNA ribosyltransferase-isomerase
VRGQEGPVVDDVATEGLDPRLAPYAYTLPDSQIARFPPAERAGGRLLCVEEGLVDRQVMDLPALLRAGDLLVVNNTRVLPARLRARRASGGEVEVLLLGMSAGRERALVRPSRRLKPGERLQIGDFAVTLLEKEPDGAWWVDPGPDPVGLMERHGAMPLPPYLRRPAEGADQERYQTAFARERGAVAAPTAGLHFSPALLAQIADRGVTIAEVTLHVGIGTFRNLSAADLDQGQLHAERWQVPASTAAAVGACRDRGGRVVAVGTTVTRTLESAALPGGRIAEGVGETRLFIQPGYRFAVVDRLFTNFHLPCSSLLMLACAFGGRERVLGSYRHAVEAGYRFFSYGDAMWLSPSATEEFDAVALAQSR